MTTQDCINQVSAVTLLGYRNSSFYKRL